MLEKLGIKKLIIIAITFILIIIVIFGGALLYNKLLYSKTYSEVESIMTEAAKDYYDKYEEKLPKVINDSITVNAETLVKNNTMKDLDNYLKDSACSGEVTVTNINGEDYRYTAMLDCDEDYQTQTLIDYIDENVEIVTSSDGLYELNDALIYRGVNVDNYLKLNGKKYRIVKFVNGHAVVILTETTESIDWDSNYNSVTDDKSGINNYETSDIKNYLENMYEATGSDSLLSTKTRLLVTNYSAAIGKRCNDDTDKSGALENAIVFENQYIGLLPASDFLNASLDENCTNTNSKSCGNFNYLAKYKNNWWTATANSKNTYKAYAVVNGVLESTPASELAYVRPVLYLASDAIYVSGDGSKDNPFEIK